MWGFSQSLLSHLVFLGGLYVNISYIRMTGFFCQRVWWNKTEQPTFNVWRISNLRLYFNSHYTQYTCNQIFLESQLDYSGNRKSLQVTIVYIYNTSNQNKCFIIQYTVFHLLHSTVNRVLLSSTNNRIHIYLYILTDWQANNAWVTNDFNSSHPYPLKVSTVNRWREVMIICPQCIYQYP